MPLRQKLGLGFVMLWFFGGSIGHFVPPGTAFFVSIVPLWLPNPKALVYISGVLEIISATGLFFAVTRRWAGYALILIVGIGIDYRRQQARLRELEASGVVRRSGRTATDI